VAPLIGPISSGKKKSFKAGFSGIMCISIMSKIVETSTFSRPENRQKMIGTHSRVQLDQYKFVGPRVYLWNHHFMTPWTYGQRGRMAYGHGAVNVRVSAFWELRSLKRGKSGLCPPGKFKTQPVATAHINLAAHKRVQSEFE
jgi:hypothetical protein